jgi:hypothetical protein
MHPNRPQMRHIYLACTYLSKVAVAQNALTSHCRRNARRECGRRSSAAAWLSSTWFVSIPPQPLHPVTLSLRYRLCGHRNFPTLYAQWDLARFRTFSWCVACFYACSYYSRSPTNNTAKEDVIGGISAILWSLTILPLLKYVGFSSFHRAIAMALNSR